jgi:hypothetical protein
MINSLTGDNFDLAFRALLRAIDALLMCSVKNRTTSAPPGSPANGDAYIVQATGTGAWASHDNAIAIWTTDNPAAGAGEWEFYAAAGGILVYSVADTTLYFWNGTAWTAVAGGGGGGGGGGAPTAIAGVNNQTANYTLVLGDAGFLVRMNVGAANNCTIPPNSSVAFPVDTVVSIRQIGAGITTIVAGAGVTINSPATLAIARQNGTVQLVQVATDTWDLMGDVT